MTVDLLDFVPPAKIPDGVVMDFTASRVGLAGVLSTVGSIIPQKFFLPLLTNFHLRLEGDLLRVTGTDSSVTVIQDVPWATAKTTGEAVFPLKFLNLVRDADSEWIHVRVMSKKEKQFATIKTDKTTWTLPLASPLDYPNFSEVLDVPLVEVNRVALLEALQKVRKSASVDPMRPYLMLVDLTGDRIRASDSHRFQEAKFSFPFPCQIPVNAAHELVQRLISSNLENVEVGQTDYWLIYRFDKVLMVAQKNVAQFPDVDEVLLKPNLSNDQDLTVDRKVLLAAIKRTRITADENTSAVVLSLNTGWVSVQTKDYKGGTAVESVEAIWNYPPRHVAFNHQYLTELLNSTKSDTCVFRLGKDLKTRPTPLLMEDPEDGFVAVLSQIRVDWLE